MEINHAGDFFVFIDCPLCKKQILVVCGLSSPATNLCGYCKRSFELVDKDYEPQEPDDL